MEKKKNLPLSYFPVPHFYLVEDELWIEASSCMCSTKSAGFVIEPKAKKDQKFPPARCIRVGSKSSANWSSEKGNPALASKISYFDLLRITSQLWLNHLQTKHNEQCSGFFLFFFPFCAQTFALQQTTGFPTSVVPPRNEICSLSAEICMMCSTCMRMLRFRAHLWRGRNEEREKRKEEGSFFLRLVS